MDILLLAVLTVVASAIGTITGFGTSTMMVPVLVAFFPLPQALLLVGVKDDLVPVSHSRLIRDAFAAQKIEHQLIEYPNAGHGFTGDDQKSSTEEMVKWFEKQLGKK